MATKTPEQKKLEAEAKAKANAEAKAKANAEAKAKKEAEKLAKLEAKIKADLEKETPVKEFKIVDANNVHIRTFDTKTHGKDASELASGFVKKFKNFIIEEIEEPRTDEADFTSVPGKKRV